MDTITFPTQPAGVVGTPATLTATGGGSANPVVFTVDATSEFGVCTVSGTNGTTVNYTATGTCVVDANQAGSTGFSSATQVQQSIASGLLTQTITYTGPTTGVVGTPGTLSATGGGSPNPVVFTVDETSGAGVCNVTGTNGTTVNYTAAGNCVIDANQAGTGSYAAANQVQQTIVVSSAGGGGGGGGGGFTFPTLTITAPSPSIVAGAAIPALTPTYSPTPGATLITPATCTTAATSASAAGGYTVTCSGAVDPSYIIAYVSGTLTIQGPATVTPPPTTRPDALRPHRRVTAGRHSGRQGLVGAR